MGGNRQSFLAQWLVYIVVAGKEAETMGWDYGFFISKNNLFQKQEATATEKPNENKIMRCAGCNQPIGTISTTLYSIEETQYCVDCYSKMIINQAVDRDHFDIKQEKLLKAAST